MPSSHPYSPISDRKRSTPSVLTTSGPYACDQVGSAAEAPVQDRDALFRELSPLVKRLARQYGQTSELRQDLPGELYCQFHTLLDNYDPERGVPLRFYLIRQLAACAYTFARKQWTWKQREAPLLEGVERNAIPPLMDPTSEWDAALSLREMSASLPGMIAELPLRQRQVMIWRYYEDRSFEEIAGMLGVQPVSARSLLRHGLNRLRQRMIGTA